MFLVAEYFSIYSLYVLSRILPNCNEIAKNRAKTN